MINRYSPVFSQKSLTSILTNEDNLIAFDPYRRHFNWYIKWVLSNRKNPKSSYIGARGMVIAEDIKRNKIAMMYIPDISK